MKETESMQNSYQAEETVRRNSIAPVPDQTLLRDDQSKPENLYDTHCLETHKENVVLTKPLTQQLKDKLNHFVGHLHQAPEYMIDSAFILTGYRINFSSPKKILKSLFMAHNETVNIWSHLLGVIMMLILIIFLASSVASNFSNTRFTHNTAEKINGYFNPLYNQIANFTELEKNWRTQIQNTKKDLTKLRAVTLEGLEEKVNSLIKEFEIIKREFNPDNVMQVLQKLQLKIESVADSYKDIQESLGSLHLRTLNQVVSLADNLKRNLVDFEESLISSLTGSSYEWLDIYTYFNTHAQKMEQRVPSDPKRLSRWPILIFLICAIFCLTGSTLFHLFYVLSKDTGRMLQRLDYAGITFLINGSTFPPVYYGFYCQPAFYQFYFILIGVPCLMVFMVSMMDFIYTEKWRRVKGFMYGGLGIFTGVPLIQLTIQSMNVSPENDYLPFDYALPYYLLMGFAYLGGLSIYLARCPERFKPGKFDICGHSHQLWHACVILGIVLTYLGAFENYYTRLDIPCMIS